MHISEDAWITAMKRVPMWICRETIVFGAFNCRNNIPTYEACEPEWIFCHGPTKIGHKSNMCNVLIKLKLKNVVNFYLLMLAILIIIGTKDFV
jgi:hypothetical protein